jgi:hypothetical protein
MHTKIQMVREREERDDEDQGSRRTDNIRHGGGKHKGERDNKRGGTRNKHSLCRVGARTQTRRKKPR